MRAKSKYNPIFWVLLAEYEFHALQGFTFTISLDQAVVSS